jgi:hypothetical protein
MGGVEMQDRTLDLRHGAVGPVTIVLSPDTGAIAGKVENARPSAAVVLMPAHAAGRGQIRQIPLDANGQYQFKPIPVGDYKLVVVDGRDIPEILGSGVLGFYEEDARPIKVRVQDSLTIDLKQP